MRRTLVSLFGLLCLLVLLAGCGGGGGGTGASLYSLSYSSDWSHRIAGNGDSQLVTLYNADGISLNQLVLNYTDTAPLSFGGLTAGKTYKVVATLYPGLNETGSPLGTITKYINATSNTSLQTIVGDTIASVQVYPANATLTANYTQQFTAQAVGLSGKLTFSDPAQFTWSTIGGVATVNSTGMLTATSAGTGAVKAQYNPTGASGSGGLTISPFVPVHTKWTVLVWLASANSLDTYSVLNMNQMEKAASPDVRFVVQWKLASGLASGTPGFNAPFASTRRYVVNHDTDLANLNSTVVQDLGDGVDSGSATNMKAFLDWATPLYPSDHYCLVVWDHGAGWRDHNKSILVKPRDFSLDDQNGTTIQSWELSTALQGHHFDIVAWDACLQQGAELAYELKDYADFVAGSEDNTPGPGYPYDKVFAGFAANPSDTPRNLSQNLVTAMISNYGNSIACTQSVIDTSKLPAVATAVSQLSSDLIANSANSSVLNGVTATRNVIQTFYLSSTKYYQDLRDMAQTLKTQSGMPTAIQNDCDAVDAAAAAAVVWEGHNSLSPRSKGLSIDNSPSSLFSGVAADYAKMKWSSASNWGNWLLVGP